MVILNIPIKSWDYLKDKHPSFIETLEKRATFNRTGVAVHISKSQFEFLKTTVDDDMPQKEIWEARLKEIADVV